MTVPSPGGPAHAARARPAPVLKRAGTAAPRVSRRCRCSRGSSGPVGPVTTGEVDGFHE